MSKLTTIICDGPMCFRIIESKIHDGGWITLISGNTFNREGQKQQETHYCSFVCLGKKMLRENPYIFNEVTNGQSTTR